MDDPSDRMKEIRRAATKEAAKAKSEAREEVEREGGGNHERIRVGEVKFGDWRLGKKLIKNLTVFDRIFDIIRRLEEHESLFIALPDDLRVLLPNDPLQLKLFKFRKEAHHT